MTAPTDELYMAQQEFIDRLLEDHAWRAVWEHLVKHGMLSFLGGDGTGIGRALAFIDKLAARDARSAAAKQAINGDDDE